MAPPEHDPHQQPSDPGSAWGSGGLPPDQAGYGGGPPPYQQQAPSNGLGTAALVVGIIALILGIVFAPLGILAGIAAVVMGILGMRKASRGEATNRGQALAGLITGAIGLLIGIVVVAFFATFIANNVDEIGSYAECVEQAQDDAEINACAEEFGSELSN